MRTLRLWGGTFLFLMIFGCFAYGNDQERDAEFARMLLKWGYDDLAEDCVRNVLKGKDFLGEGSARRDNFQKGDAEYVLIELEQFRSESSKSEEDRKKHIEKYKALLASFQQKYPGHPQALSAALSVLLADRQQAVHEFEKGRIEPEEGPKKKRIGEGVKLFASTLKKFDTLIKKYQAAMDKEIKTAMETRKKQAKDEFEKEDIDEYSTQNWLAQNSDGFLQLFRRRVFAEFLRGDTCLLFIRWQERLGLDESLSTYLTIANQAFKKIEYDYSGFEDFAGMAGIGLGEVLIRQGKSKLAINKFDSFRLFRFQFPSNDPSVREQQEGFAKEISTKAYHGLASAWIKEKNYENAIIMVNNMFERYPDALTVEGGRMALLSKCEALILKSPPEPHKAMEEAMKIVEWSKKNEKRVPGRDFGISALRAAIRMSEIREKMEGPVEFSPEVSLLIATGFYETGKYKWAVYAYKDVLANAEVEEELTVFALKGMANCYYNTRRYEEAAMAFSGVLERFPDRSEAIKMAKQALYILNKQFGPEDEAVREFKKNLENRLGGAATYYNQGVEARIQAVDFKEQKKTKKAEERFNEAVEAFLKVKRVDPNTGNPVRYYGDAQSAVGDCYYQIYLLSGKTEKLQAAISHLKKMINQFTPSNRRGWAASAYYLGRIYVDQEKFKEALTVLKPFDDRLASVNRYAVPAKSLIIQSAVAMGNNSLAAQQFDDLYKKEGLSPRTAQAATLLTVTYSKFVDRELEKIRNGFKSYFFLFNKSNLADLVNSKKIVNYLLQKNKAGVPRLKIAQSQAARYAVFLFEYYTKKNLADFGRLYWLGDMVLKANNYAKAIKIFEQAVKMSPKADAKAAKGEVTTNQRYVFFAKRFLADSYLGLGRQSQNTTYLKTALEWYDKLSEDKNFDRSIFMYRILEGKAIASEEIGKISRSKGDLAKAIENYRVLKDRLYKMMSRRDQYAAIKKVDEPEIEERYYQITYTFFELLFRVGNFKEVHQRIQSLKNQNSDFGTDELKQKFEKLFDAAKGRIG